MKKTISIAGIIISIIMVVSVSIIYIPTFFGMYTVPVNSSEMSPRIMNGSLCFIKKSDNTALEVGDVIGLKNEDGHNTIRRIVRIKPSNGQMLTKGDNLELLDKTPLNQENIIGKSVFAIPLLGFISGILATLVGKIIFGVVFVIVLGLSIYLIIDIKKNKALTTTI